MMNPLRKKCSIQPQPEALFTVQEKVRTKIKTSGKKIQHAAHIWERVEGTRSVFFFHTFGLTKHAHSRLNLLVETASIHLAAPHDEGSGGKRSRLLGEDWMGDDT